MNEEELTTTPEPAESTSEVISVDYTELLTTVQNKQDFSSGIELMLLFTVWVLIGVNLVSIFRGR